VFSMRDIGTTYVRTYRHCDSRVADPSAPTYDPAGVAAEREDLARDAADAGSRAPWVAWIGPWSRGTAGFSRQPGPGKREKPVRPRLRSPFLTHPGVSDRGAVEPPVFLGSRDRGSGILPALAAWQPSITT
jgi:hypothetical protein